MTNYRDCKYLYINGKRVNSIARRWEDIAPLVWIL